ncbi:MAG: saccharopine dehydrogenase C-terminal domain-containing protein [Hyphomicrobiales bacterium]
MKIITILGAGLSATSLINYLLEHSEKHNWKVKVGDMSVEVAQRKIGNHKNAEAFYFDVNDTSLRKKVIQDADVVVSMLPASLHYYIAEDCVSHKTPLFTASYVSKEIKALDQAAKDAGILLANELGLDPGIDHMSAMKVIDEIRNEGGVMEGFYSSTGGLVVPECDTNPWHYKFTWNPRNVVLAGQGVAMYIERGIYKYIPYQQLFERTQPTTILNYGNFEIYPNRDSLKYRGIYGLESIPTMFRGTIRRPGYSKAWNILVQLGCTDDTYIMENTKNMTMRQFTNSFLFFDPDMSVEEKIVKYFNLDPKGEIMKKLEFIGLFSDEKIGLENVSPAKVLQNILEKKWALEEDDRDMIVMQHRFVYTLNGEKKRKQSSLVVEGKENETSMAITVGVPLAITVKLFLTGKLNVTGVHVPTTPEFYTPILQELENYGVKFIEEEY